MLGERRRGEGWFDERGVDELDLLLIVLNFLLDDLELLDHD